MFSDKRFKVKCENYCCTLLVLLMLAYSIIDTVDKRGRRVKQSSSDDLRKYYDLNGKRVALGLLLNSLLKEDANLKSDNRKNKQKRALEQSLGKLFVL